MLTMRHLKMFVFLRCHGAVEASEDKTSFFFLNVYRLFIKTLWPF